MRSFIAATSVAVALGIGQAFASTPVELKVTHDWTYSFGSSRKYYGIREYHFLDLSNRVARGDMILADDVTHLSPDYFTTVVFLPGREFDFPCRLRVFTIIFATFILLSSSAIVSAIYFARRRSREIDDEPTKPVEPTGVDGSPSD